METLRELPNVPTDWRVSPLPGACAAGPPPPPPPGPMDTRADGWLSTDGGRVLSCEDEMGPSVVRRMSFGLSRAPEYSNLWYTSGTPTSPSGCVYQRERYPSLTGVETHINDVAAGHLKPIERSMARKTTQYSAAELVAKAEALVDQCQPELAVQFYEKALLQEPNSTALLDVIGELSTELDNPERAFQAFQQSISIAPAQNPAKWFYMAQLVQGEEAENFSKQGIAYLLQELQTLDPQTEEAQVVKKQICDAYCALGELYMTDLCDEDEAESRCENYFMEAMKYDIGLPEPIQALANLRLTQQRKDEAVPLLEETYRRLNENCNENSMPTLEFRVFTGKLLIEVEKYEEASDVLEGVMQEDDENAELWFLVGTCYRAMDDVNNALEFFEKCGEMLKKLKKQLRGEFYLDEQLESVEEAIVALKENIATRPAEEDDEDEDASDEEELENAEDVDMEG